METSLDIYTITMITNFVLLVVSALLARYNRSLRQVLDETVRYLYLSELKLRQVRELVETFEEFYEDRQLTPDEMKKLVEMLKKILDTTPQEASSVAGRR